MIVQVFNGAARPWRGAVNRQAEGFFPFRLFFLPVFPGPYPTSYRWPSTTTVATWDGSTSRLNTYRATILGLSPSPSP